MGLHGITLFATLLLIVVPTLILAYWLQLILRIGSGTAGFMSLGINIVVVIAVLFACDPGGFGANREPRSASPTLLARLQSDQGAFYLLVIMFTTNLGLALLAKLYRAAVLGKATPQENSPGMIGTRAWLSPPNVFAVVCVAAGAYFAMGYDYLGVVIVGVCLLLAYPLVNTMLQQSPGAGMPLDPMSPLKAPADERQRVLALVEAGKITAEDGAELLTAMAQSQVASVSAKPISGPRRVMLAGAAIMLVGFLLPWFMLNELQAIRDVAAGIQQNFSPLPGSSSPNFNLTPSALPQGGVNGVPTQTMMQISVRGGDVQHGLGWIALAAAFCAAGLPFFWSGNHDIHQERNAIFAALAVGSVALIYLLSGSFNSVTTTEPGFYIAIAGYALLWVGGLREYIAVRPRFQATLAAV